LNFTNPYSSGLVTPNPFPLPFSPTATTTFPLGSQYIFLPAHFHTPYVLQYTASVQREFGHGWQAQVDYIGNKSTHEISVLPLSQAVYTPGVWGAGGTGCAGIATTGPNAVTPGAAGTPCSTTGNEASRFVLTEANPAEGPYYGGGSSNAGEIFGSAQTASYNGMVASLNHRLSSSFVLMANYTWSHCIDLEDNGGDSGVSEQNPANLKAEKGACGFDYRDVFNVTVVASSHFSSLHGFLGQAANGWTISPLVRAEDGTVFTVTSGLDNSLTDLGNDRPNLTNPSALYTHQKIRSGAVHQRCGVYAESHRHVWGFRTKCLPRSKVLTDGCCLEPLFHVARSTGNELSARGIQCLEPSGFCCSRQQRLHWFEYSDDLFDVWPSHIDR
jgi:hypothetical protein